MAEAAYIRVSIPEVLRREDADLLGWGDLYGRHCRGGTCVEMWIVLLGADLVE